MTNTMVQPVAIVDDSVNVQPTYGEPRGEPVTSVLHLAELVPIVRNRLAIDSALPDDAILAALTTITAKSHTRARWKAAFSSNLGHWLALKGEDLNASLTTLMSLLPLPRN